MESGSLCGVYPAIVTPFTATGQLDEAALAKLTDYVIDGGVQAIMTTGGTGEFPHLDREERRRVDEIVVRQARGCAPVIAGTAGAPRSPMPRLTDRERAGLRAALVELGLL